MEYNFVEIGERIRTERKKRKWSQEDLIGELNNQCNLAIARNRLSGIENGNTDDFGLKIMLAICKLYGWDIGFLFGEYKETTKHFNDIHEYTGLSESAIKKLHRYKKRSDAELKSGWFSCETRAIHGINALIEKNIDLFYDIADYLYFCRFNDLEVVPDSKEYPNLKDDNGPVDEIKDTEAYINGEYIFNNQVVLASKRFEYSDTSDLLLLKIQRELLQLREKVLKKGGAAHG